MFISKLAKEIAQETQDAYSVPRFRSWAAVAQAALSFGLNREEAVWVLRSKNTRWAADTWNGARYGRNPARALTSYLETCGNLKGLKAEIAKEMALDKGHATS